MAGSFSRHSDVIGLIAISIHLMVLVVLVPNFWISVLCASLAISIVIVVVNHIFKPASKDNETSIVTKTNPNKLDFRYLIGKAIVGYEKSDKNQKIIIKIVALTAVMILMAAIIEAIQSDSKCDPQKPNTNECLDEGSLKAWGSAPNPQLDSSFSTLLLPPEPQETNRNMTLDV